MLLSLGIVAFVAAYAWRGWRRGLTREVVDVVGVIGTIVLAAAVAPAAGDAIAAATPVPSSGGTVLAASALVAAGLGGVLLLGGRLPRWLAELPPGGRQIDRAGGPVFTVVWGLVVVTGVLALSVSLPGSRVSATGPVCGTALSRALVSPSSPLTRAGERFAELVRPAVAAVDPDVAAADAVAAGTSAPPGSLLGGVRMDGLCVAGPIAAPRGGQPFRFPPATADAVTVDADAAADVLVRLNVARSAHGLAPLDPDRDLAAVGAAHAMDLYLRGYFSHDTLECVDDADAPGCLDPFERLRRSGVEYLVAGENLALAASADAAHTGLMDSPSHRANILGADFRRVGITVLRGPVGLLVVQEFAG